jgi:hypothetical protein
MKGDEPKVGFPSCSGLILNIPLIQRGFLGRNVPNVVSLGLSHDLSREISSTGFQKLS